MLKVLLAGDAGVPKRPGRNTAQLLEAGREAHQVKGPLSSHLGAAGLRAAESGHARRMLGIALLALSADCRSRALESGRDCVDLGGYGIAQGVALGVGATPRG